MLLPGREWQEGYRFGFNGKEKTDEIHGDDNFLDFGARIYNARLGRWLSVDPLQCKYPNISPYTYTLDNPILYLDIDGRDVGVSIEKDPSGNGGKITLTSTVYVTGIDAEGSVEAYNAAFKEWSDNGKNTGIYTDESGNNWTIEIKMDFKVATAEDIERIKSAGQEKAAENSLTVSEQVYDELTGSELMGKTYRLATDDFTGYPNELINGIYRDASRSWTFAFRTGEIQSQAPGNIAIHEVLHMYGFDDWYLLAKYKTYNTVTGTTGSTGVVSQPIVGYENDPMGDPLNGTMNMNQQHWNDLGKYLMNMSQDLGDNFIFSRMFEKANGGIPSNYCEDENTECIDPEIVK